MQHMTQQIEALKTTINLMTGDLRYCNTRSQAASLMGSIRQREEELKKLEEQVRDEVPPSTFINRCVAALDDAPMGEHNVYIHWFRIDYGSWLDAEAVVNAGGLEDYLKEQGLSAEDVAELMTRDWDCQDAEGLALRCLGNHGGFDWLKLEELLEAADDVGAEVLCAGLKAGLSVDTIADAYLGEHESPEDYAYQQWEDAGILAGMPEAARGYINWEAVARDMELSGEITHHGSHYFRTI